MSKKIYGCIPDTPDQRDFKMSIKLAPENIPAVVDFTSKCPPVLNQGDLGSCTANGIANAHLFEQMKQVEKGAFLPSRLFVYYNERVIEKTVNSDSGAQIKDGIKTIAKQGVCPETMWAYNIKKFTTKPSAKCYKEGLKHLALQYLRVDQTLGGMKNCLAQGYPFIMGFSVYESFESDAVAKSGIVPMPVANEKLLGGHCVWVIGYNDVVTRFRCMNSWGTDWGQKGYFEIPYDYLINSDLASDFWTIRLVE